MNRILTFIILSAFLINSFGPVPLAQAQDYHLPAPGIMVHLSPPLDPPILKGIKVHPNNPLNFDFILDKGDSELSNSQIKDESSKLIKYFLASLTIPEKDLWVNLSPYEKDRIIPSSFGLTEMGRDLLAEDYMLKQITASLIYPEDEVGKKFWKRIYEEAAKRYGTTNISVNTFNKVWIVPDKAVIYENAKLGTAYVVESRLKVMLEQDYLSLEKHAGIQSSQAQTKDTNQLGSQIVREIVIPELSREVNENKNFARLRQVYNSLILATWYKKKIKDSILELVYVDKNKTAGVQYISTIIPMKAGIHFKNDIEGLYKEYLRAFKKGVYNYIKEDIDPITQETIPRKYFSGGADFAGRFGISSAMTSATPSQAMNAVESENDRAMVIDADVEGSQSIPGSEHALQKHGVEDFIEQTLNSPGLRPDPLQILEQIRNHGLTAETINHTARVLGFQPLWMNETTIEVNSLVPYLQKIFEKIIKDYGDYKVLFAGRDAENIYDAFIVMSRLSGHAHTDASLFPGSMPFYNENPPAAFYRDLGITKESILRGQKILIMDAGLQGTIGSRFISGLKDVFEYDPDFERLSECIDRQIVSKLAGGVAEGVSKELLVSSGEVTDENRNEVKSQFPKSYKIVETYIKRMQDTLYETYKLTTNLLLAAALQTLPRFYGKYLRYDYENHSYIVDEHHRKASGFNPDIDGAADRIDASIIHPYAALMVQYLLINGILSQQGVRKNSARQDSAMKSVSSEARVGTLNADQAGDQDFGDEGDTRALAEFHKNTAATNKAIDAFRSLKREVKQLHSLSTQERQLIDNLDIIASDGYRGFGSIYMLGWYEESPWILLNAQLVESANAGQLRWLLGHELAHLLLRDVDIVLAESKYKELQEKAITKVEYELQIKEIKALIEDRCDAFATLFSKGLATQEDVIGLFEIMDSIAAERKSEEFFSKTNSDFTDPHRGRESRDNFLRGLFQKDGTLLLNIFNDKNWPGFFRFERGSKETGTIIAHRTRVSRVSPELARILDAKMGNASLHQDNSNNPWNHGSDIRAPWVRVHRDYYGILGLPHYTKTIEASRILEIPSVKLDNILHPDNENSIWEKVSDTEVSLKSDIKISTSEIREIIGKDFERFWPLVLQAMPDRQAAIKLQYRNKAQELHPDKFVDKTAKERKKAEEDFKLLGEAYEVLKDPVTKREYDEWYQKHDFSKDPNFYPLVDETVVAAEGLNGPDIEIRLNELRDQEEQRVKAMGEDDYYKERFVRNRMPGDKMFSTFLARINNFITLKNSSEDGLTLLNIYIKSDFSYKRDIDNIMDTSRWEDAGKSEVLVLYKDVHGRLQAFKFNFKNEKALKIEKDADLKEQLIVFNVPPLPTRTLKVLSSQELIKRLNRNEYKSFEFRANEWQSLEEIKPLLKKFGPMTDNFLDSFPEGFFRLHRLTLELAVKWLNSGECKQPFLDYLEYIKKHGEDESTKHISWYVNEMKERNFPSWYYNYHEIKRAIIYLLYPEATPNPKRYSIFTRESGVPMSDRDLHGWSVQPFLGKFGFVRSSMAPPNGAIRLSSEHLGIYYDLFFVQDISMDQKNQILNITKYDEKEGYKLKKYSFNMSNGRWQSLGDAAMITNKLSASSVNRLSVYAESFLQGEAGVHIQYYADEALYKFETNGAENLNDSEIYYLGNVNPEQLRGIMPKIVDRLTKENFNSNMRPILVEMIKQGEITDLEGMLNKRISKYIDLAIEEQMLSIKAKAIVAERLGLLDFSFINHGKAQLEYDMEYGVAVLDDDTFKLIASLGVFGFYYHRFVFVPKWVMRQAKEGNKAFLSIIAHEKRHEEYHKLHGEYHKILGEKLYLEQTLVDELFAWFGADIDMSDSKHFNDLIYALSIAGVLIRQYIEGNPRMKESGLDLSLLKFKISLAADVISQGLMNPVNRAKVMEDLKYATTLNEIIAHQPTYQELVRFTESHNERFFPSGKHNLLQGADIPRLITSFLSDLTEEKYLGFQRMFQERGGDSAMNAVHKGDGTLVFGNKEDYGNSIWYNHEHARGGINPEKSVLIRYSWQYRILRDYLLNLLKSGQRSLKIVSLGAGREGREPASIAAYLLWLQDDNADDRSIVDKELGQTLKQNGVTVQIIAVEKVIETGILQSASKSTALTDQFAPFFEDKKAAEMVNKYLPEVRKRDWIKPYLCDLNVNMNELLKPPLNRTIDKPSGVDADIFFTNEIFQYLKPRAIVNFYKNTNEYLKERAIILTSSSGKKAIFNAKYKSTDYLYDALEKTTREHPFIKIGNFLFKNNAGSGGYFIKVGVKKIRSQSTAKHSPAMKTAVPLKAMLTMEQKKGGIDLALAKNILQTKNAGEAIKFHLNPAMLAQLQKAPGFVPVIINIKPMINLAAFLGISENLKSLQETTG